MSLKLLSHHSTAPEIKQLPGYPRLKPAYILKVILSRFTLSYPATLLTSVTL